MTPEEEIIIDSVASMIWWNAGVNDPDKLKAISDQKLVFAETGQPVPGPSWRMVSNKDMWRRMAVAAVGPLGANGISAFRNPLLVEKYAVRQDVPE